MPATLAEVARKAGVSIGTASRVLNGASVHPLLRTSVQDAIRDLGYRPNGMARSLRRSKAGAIGVLVSDLIRNPIFTAMLSGIEEIGGPTGLGIFLSDAGGSASRQRVQLERMYERRVDGLILHPVSDYAEALEPFEESGIPVVVVGQRRPSGSRLEVVVDEYGASLEAARHLIRLGHARIGLLLQKFRDSVPLRSSAQESRLDAYLEAHRESGLPVDESLIAYARDVHEDEAVAKLMVSRADRPTAIMSGAQPLVANLVYAIRAAGLRVPRDISVVSYGDSRWMEFHEPPITVVTSDYVEYGRAAARLFLDRQSGDRDTVLHHPVHLVIRESCGPPALSPAATEAPAG